MFVNSNIAFIHAATNRTRFILILFSSLCLRQYIAYRSTTQKSRLLYQPSTSSSTSTNSCEHSPTFTLSVFATAISSPKISFSTPVARYSSFVILAPQKSLCEKSPISATFVLGTTAPPSSSLEPQTISPPSMYGQAVASWLNSCSVTLFSPENQASTNSLRSSKFLAPHQRRRSWP